MNKHTLKFLLPDQAEVAARISEMKSEAASLERKLGDKAPARPAYPADDMLAEFSALDQHLARCRAQARIAAPPSKPLATSTPKAAAGEDKKPSLTERCLIVKAGGTLPERPQFDGITARCVAHLAANPTKPTDSQKRFNALMVKHHASAK